MGVRFILKYKMTEYIIVFKSLDEQITSFTNTWEAESIQVFNKTWLGLSRTGSLFTIPFPEVSSPSQFLMSVEITQISSNSTACLLLSASGRVYALGEDPENYGFLGHYNTSSSSPYLIQDLTNIEQISLGKSHAGALSISSSFFLWGKCPSVSSSTPTRQSFELFTIQRFECGDNFSLLTTTGGYLYIIGQLGFTHKQPKTPAPIGAFSPPDIEKMCVTFSTAGYQFVVFINDRSEAFVFDGCLEIVKLPMQSFQRIETVRVFGDKIIGICEDEQLIEWILDRGKDETDCNLYFFTGHGYKHRGKFMILGQGEENLFVLSDLENIVEDKSEIIMPYKRTEYGKKLISKVRESVKVSGKFDFMKSSVENSPVFKFEKNNDFAKCIKVVYAFNFVIRKFFSSIKVYASALKSKGMFRNRGVFGMFFRNYQKNIHLMLARAFEKFLINVEIMKLRDALIRSGTERLVDTLNRIFLYFGLQGLIHHKKTLAALKIFSTLEQKTLKKELLFFTNLKVDLRLWKLKKVLLPKLKLSFSHGFIQVKKEFKQSKSCTGLANVLRKRLYSYLFPVFHSLKSYSYIMDMHRTVFKLHKDCSISTLTFKLNIYKIRSQRPAFNIIKHLYIFSKLKKILNPHLSSVFNQLNPRIISPTLLNLQKLFINLVLREKLISLKEILYKSYSDNSIEQEIDMLSPIKGFNTNENIEDLQIKCETLDFPLVPSKKRKKSSSMEISDFQKYLLWYREFKTRPKSKKKNKKVERPPWRPSGLAIKKTRNEDETIKKNCERRRDYSESIRSSKSSFSDEDSFCRRIGWDKEAYIRRFKDRRVRELGKLVAVKSFKRTIDKALLRVWRKIKPKNSSQPKQLKKLVDSNWKIGFVNIGINKILAFMKKKAIRIIVRK